jgi:hypothetical protein
MNQQANPRLRKTELSSIAEPRPPMGVLLGWSCRAGHRLGANQLAGNHNQLHYKELKSC